MVCLFRYPFRCGDARPLPPNHHWYGQQREDTHQHAKYTKRLRWPVPLRPSTNEEGPTKGDYCARTRYDNEAVPRNCVIRLDDLSKLRINLVVGKTAMESTYVVEANRWCLHKPKGQHTDTKLTLPYG